MEEVVKLLALEGISKCVEVYGIEGTEDAIKRVYATNEQAKFVMLNILHETYMKGK